MFITSDNDRQACADMYAAVRSVQWANCLTAGRHVIHHP